MTVNSEHIGAFRHDLLDWYRSEARDLPWRSTSDPYRIWISEIMLQQTRVDQATPYYERFISAFPDVAALADAELEDVLKLWEGLGYYSRARNLHKAAKAIVEQHAGEFPGTVGAALELPGVGPYTAAAVTSIAYGVPAAAVDGNVSRVIARVFGIEEDIKSGRVQKQIRSIADDLLDTSQPGDFNQALMELGARVCTPKRPACEICPLLSTCWARRFGMTDMIPVSTARKPTPHHVISVGVVRDDDGRVLLVRRPTDRLLGGLWEFPGARQREDESLEQACARGIFEKLGLVVTPFAFLTTLTHQFSHFKITMHAFWCSTTSVGEPSPDSLRSRWVHPTELDKFAMHRTARRIADLVASEPSTNVDVHYRGQ